MLIRNTSGRRGATLVEYAIVIGACFFFLFAIFEYSLFVMTRHLIDNAAREGARLAVSGTNQLTTAEIQDRVTQGLAGRQLGSLNIQVFQADSSGNNVGSWNNAGFGQRIAVQIDCTYSPILPTLGFLPDPITLRARSVMRSEAN